jgi:hypothetical protein
MRLSLNAFMKFISLAPDSRHVRSRRLPAGKPPAIPASQKLGAFRGQMKCKSEEKQHRPEMTLMESYLLPRLLEAISLGSRIWQ